MEQLSEGEFFTSTWKTDNVHPSSPYNTYTKKIKLYLVSSGTYNFIVDWGDGSESHITTWNQAEVTHGWTIDDGGLG